MSSSPDFISEAERKVGFITLVRDQIKRLGKQHFERFLERIHSSRFISNRTGEELCSIPWEPMEKFGNIITTLGNNVAIAFENTNMSNSIETDLLVSICGQLDRYMREDADEKLGRRRDRHEKALQVVEKHVGDIQFDIQGLQSACEAEQLEPLRLLDESFFKLRGMLFELMMLSENLGSARKEAQLATDMASMARKINTVLQASKTGSSPGAESSGGSIFTQMGKMSGMVGGESSKTSTAHRTLRNLISVTPSCSETYDYSEHQSRIGGGGSYGAELLTSTVAFGEEEAERQSLQTPRYNWGIDDVSSIHPCPEDTMAVSSTVASRGHNMDQNNETFHQQGARTALASRGHNMDHNNETFNQQGARTALASRGHNVDHNNETFHQQEAKTALASRGNNVDHNNETFHQQEARTALASRGHNVDHNNETFHQQKARTAPASRGHNVDHNNDTFRQQRARTAPSERVKESTPLPKSSSLEGLNFLNIPKLDLTMAAPIAHSTARSTTGCRSKQTEYSNVSWDSDMAQSPEVRPDHVTKSAVRRNTQQKMIGQLFDEPYPNASPRFADQVVTEPRFADQVVTEPRFKDQVVTECDNIGPKNNDQADRVPFRSCDPNHNACNNSIPRQNLYQTQMQQNFIETPKAGRSTMTPYAEARYHRPIPVHPIRSLSGMHMTSLCTCQCDACVSASARSVISPRLASRSCFCCRLCSFLSHWWTCVKSSHIVFACFLLMMAIFIFSLDWQVTECAPYIWPRQFTLLYIAQALLSFNVHLAHYEPPLM